MIWLKGQGSKQSLCRACGGADECCLKQQPPPKRRGIEQGFRYLIHTITSPACPSSLVHNRKVPQFSYKNLVLEQY